MLEPLELQPGDPIFEIGPGQGALTELLLARTGQVTAIEVDPRLGPYLRESLGHYPGFRLIYGDIRYSTETFIRELAPADQLRAIANIPYHLTSEILFQLLNLKPMMRENVHPGLPLFRDILLMVQHEVAFKLLAQPGDEGFGLLSLQVQYAAEVDLLAELPRDLFDPAPKVDSAMVWFRPRRTPPVDVPHIGHFWELLTRIYQLRRKNLRNVLRTLSWANQAPEGWDLGLRGETLDLEQLAQLATAIEPVA